MGQMRVTTADRTTDVPGRAAGTAPLPSTIGTLASTLRYVVALAIVLAFALAFALALGLGLILGLLPDLLLDLCFGPLFNGTFDLSLGGKLSRFNANLGKTNCTCLALLFRATSGHICRINSLTES